MYPRTRLTVAAVAAACLTMPTAASAAVLFSDSFDRENSRNIDGSVAGITNNTGTALGVDGVYTHAFIDPNNADPTNGDPDGGAANGGGAQILENQLELADGPGTANAYINHNFTNPSILAGGGFTVTVDLAGVNQSGTGQGGGFGIGMSQAEANSAADAISGDNKFQDGFLDGASNGADDLAVSDFWVVFRANGRLVWGGKGNSISGTDQSGLLGLVELPGFPKTGTITARFTSFADFNDGTMVDFDLFYNGTHQGNGSFAWSGTGENYIGLDARDNQGVFFDNLVIATVPEPSSLIVLAVLTIPYASSLASSAGRRRRLG